MKTPDPADPTPKADPENPWLGLSHYTPKNRDYFRGRDAEIEGISRCVRRSPLTIVYGSSGRGKSSLVGGGLIPDLEDRDYLVTLQRRCYDALAESSLIRDVIGAISQVHGSPPELKEAPTLWEFIHDRRQPWCSSSDSPEISALPPILIFDQFEEIFIKGEDKGLAEGDERQRPAEQLAGDLKARENASRFLEDLADLVENRVPAELRRRIDEAEADEQQEMLERFDFKAHHVRVVLIVREDFLARLERMRGQMPSIMEQRIELAPLSGSQAMDAIMLPGSLREGFQPIIPEDIAARIVCAASGAPEGTPPDKILNVSSSILSLICEDLNRTRQGSPYVERFSADDALGIMQRFYEQKLKSHQRVRHVLEKSLAPSGIRETPTLQSLLGQMPHVADARRHLNELQDERILVQEERGGAVRVEFTHDKLAEIAHQSWRARESTLQWRKRLVWAAGVAAVACAVTVFAWSERRKAERDFDTMIGPFQAFGDAWNSGKNTQTLADLLYAASGNLVELNDDDPRAIEVFSTSCLVQAYEQWHHNEILARQRLEESIKLRRRVVELLPHDLSKQNRFAVAQIEFGRFLRERALIADEGSPERPALLDESAAIYRQAADVYRGMASTPLSEYWLSYAHGLGHVALVHELRKDLNQALVTAEERKRVSEELVKELERTNGGVKQLNEALVSLGLSSGMEGKYAMLLAASEKGKSGEYLENSDEALDEAVAIWERLLSEESRVEWSHAKAEAFYLQGNAQGMRDNWKAALEKYVAAYGIWKALPSDAVSPSNSYGVAIALGAIATVGVKFPTPDNLESARANSIEQADAFSKVYNLLPSAAVAARVSDSLAQAGQIAIKLGKDEYAASYYGNAYDWTSVAQSRLPSGNKSENGSVYADIAELGFLTMVDDDDLKLTAGKRSLLIRRVDYAFWNGWARQRTAGVEPASVILIYESALSALKELEELDAKHSPPANAAKSVAASEVPTALEGARLIKEMIDYRLLANASIGNPGMMEQAIAEMAKSDEALEKLLKLPNASDHPYWQVERSKNYWFRAALLVAQRNLTEAHKYVDQALSTVEAINDRLPAAYKDMPTQIKEMKAQWIVASEPVK